MEMHFLPDEPALTDTLGFADFVSRLQKAIYHTKPPFVFGVLGDWGTGKTSILKQLEQLLNQDLEKQSNFYIPIWFNPWLYENEANIAYPLLHAIKRDYKKRLKDSASERKFWKDFVKVVGTSALALTDIGFRAATKQLTGDAYKLSDIAEHLKSIQEKPDELDKILNSWADQVTTLSDAFKALLDAYAADYCEENFLSGKQIKFVILVDDLDRCLPDVSIKLLESIKNYLAVENCIFVLALNPKVVYQGIKVKYQGIQIDGREYLEKILNYSFYVPLPEHGFVNNYASARLNELMLDAALQNAYAPHFATFGKVLSECSFTNPRKIKRVLNHYLLFLDKYSDKLENFTMENVPKLIVLAEYYPNIFKLWVSVKSSEAEHNLQTRLADWGETSFNIKSFESDYGISVLDLYEQLASQNRLLILKTGNAKYPLSRQAQEIYSISRLP